jgi:hypothetical protein
MTNARSKSSGSISTVCVAPACRIDRQHLLLAVVGAGQPPRRVPGVYEWPAMSLGIAASFRSRAAASTPAVAIDFSAPRLGQHRSLIPIQPLVGDLAAFESNDRRACDFDPTMGWRHGGKYPVHRHRVRKMRDHFFDDPIGADRLRERRRCGSW